MKNRRVTRNPQCVKYTFSGGFILLKNKVQALRVEKHRARRLTFPGKHENENLCLF